MAGASVPATKAFRGSRSSAGAAAHPHKGGPEGINPFWCPPEDRDANINLSMEIVDAFEELELAANGDGGDGVGSRQVLCSIFKSDDRHSVVFLMDSAVSPDDEYQQCITPVWVKAPTDGAKLSGQAAAAYQQTLDLQEPPQSSPLSALGEAFLGCTLKKSKDGKHFVHFRAFDNVDVAQPPVQLVQSQGTFWLRTEINGVPARLDYVYAQLAKGPKRDVQSISVFGTKLGGDHGQVVQVMDRLG